MGVDLLGSPERGGVDDLKSWTLNSSSFIDQSINLSDQNPALGREILLAFALARNSLPSATVRRRVQVRRSDGGANPVRRRLR